MYVNDSSFLKGREVKYMQITDLRIRNFKSIRDIHIGDIENALILVGKNNTGKTAILDAIRALGGSYAIRREDFRASYQNIEIMISLSIEEEDLFILHKKGGVSQYRRYEAWLQDFCKKLPSYKNGILTFEFVANRDGKERYGDGFQKNNPYIKEVIPAIYYMDIQRNLSQFQGDLLMIQEDELLKRMRLGCCIFDEAKTCNNCFSCIGLINQKKPEELNAFEASKLLDFKLYQLNLDSFSRKVNDNFRRNGGHEKILYSMNRDVEQMLSVTAEIYDEKKDETRSIEQLGKGMRSIYMLALLETYAKGEGASPGIVIVEEPEIFLHPQLQKMSGEILYRLAKTNQVIFSTHSPNLLPNFNSRQIRQVALDEEGDSKVYEKTDISAILEDLGYTANDLMNVNFVFIVEGKQDKNRLPMLIRKYYSETYDSEGNLSRIAIITTNSCTNIKTYANLKYMNQIYLKDSFLIIRDGDGQDSDKLKHQLCRYYEERNKVDIDKLPRVTPRNVLILKYYSFENYFLNPAVMTELGIVESEEAFYQILLNKWKEYLHKTKSGRHLTEILGKSLETVEDIKEHIEEIKIYVRGHNLYDIYYGRHRERESELLGRYIETAPREDFKDILDSIDQFIYFESKKNKENEENIENTEGNTYADM